MVFTLLGCQNFVHRLREDVEVIANLIGYATKKPTLFLFDTSPPARIGQWRLPGSFILTILSITHRLLRIGRTSTSFIIPRARIRFRISTTQARRANRGRNRAIAPPKLLKICPDVKYNKLQSF